MKTSASQFEAIVEFMERHGDLVKPGDGPAGRLRAVQLWTELAERLNLDVTGDTKTVDKWKKVWSDFKLNTKRKAAKIHQAALRTGGGPPCKLYLSDLEQRVLTLIGPQSATGLVDVPEVGVEISQPPPVLTCSTDETPTLSFSDIQIILPASDPASIPSPRPMPRSPLRRPRSASRSPLRRPGSPLGRPGTSLPRPRPALRSPLRHPRSPVQRPRSESRSPLRRSRSVSRSPLRRPGSPLQRNARLRDATPRTEPTPGPPLRDHPNWMTCQRVLLHRTNTGVTFSESTPESKPACVRGNLSSRRTGQTWRESTPESKLACVRGNLSSRRSGKIWRAMVWIC